MRAPTAPLPGLAAVDSLRGFDFLHGKANAALTINFKNLDLDDVALGELVAHFLYPLIGYLRDMHEAVLAWQNRHEGSEIHEASHFAFVDAAYFDICCDQVDAPT